MSFPVKWLLILASDRSMCYSVTYHFNIKQCLRYSVQWPFNTKSKHVSLCNVPFRHKSNVCAIQFGDYLPWKRCVCLLPYLVCSNEVTMFSPVQTMEFMSFAKWSWFSVILQKFPYVCGTSIWLPWEHSETVAGFSHSLTVCDDAVRRGYGTIGSACKKTA